MCLPDQAASAGTARDLDRAGALAALSGRRARFLIKRSVVTIGRSTSTHGQVRVSASCDIYARVLVCLTPRGCYTLADLRLTLKV